MPGELVPFTQQTALAELAPGGYLSSYRREVMADEIAMIRAVQGRDFGLDELEGEEITVEHVVCHWAQWRDETTGEVGDSVRTVLVGPDGTRYSTRSNSVRADIARICGLLGRTVPFRPALRFRVCKAKSLASNRKYLQLELLGEVQGT